MRIVFGVGLAALLQTASVEAVALQQQSSSFAQIESASETEGIMPGAGTQNAPTINIIDNNRNMSTNSAGGGGGCPIPGM